MSRYVLQIMRIGIFKTGEIGDVLMATPFIRQLRMTYPDAKILGIVGKSASPVLKVNSNVDELLVFDSTLFSKRSILGAFKLLRRIRKLKLDVLFVLDKHWIFNIFALFCKARKRIGFDRDGREGVFLSYGVPRGSEQRHEVHYYLDLLDGLGIAANRSDLQMDFQVNGSDKKAVHQLLKEHEISDFYVFSNSGGANAVEKSGIRKMPRELARGIAMLLSSRKTVVFVGGPTESSYYDGLDVPNSVNLCGKTSLAQAVALMACADKVITTDSGIMHLAGSTNTSLICIFGPTDPKRKAPLRDNVHSIWRDSAIYDDSYERYGRIPKKLFYSGVTVQDVEKWLD